METQGELWQLSYPSGSGGDDQRSGRGCEITSQLPLVDPGGSGEGAAEAVR